MALDKKSCNSQIFIKKSSAIKQSGGWNTVRRWPVVVGCAEEVEVPGLPEQAAGTPHGAGQRVPQLGVQYELPLVQPAPQSSQCLLI